jgi:hypothetical protein
MASRDNVLRGLTWLAPGACGRAMGWTDSVYGEAALTSIYKWDIVNK